MTTDQTIRSTESNRNSPAYQFRLTQTPTDTTFLDLLSTLHQPSPEQRPASLLPADVDSKLDERAYVESRRKQQDEDSSKATDSSDRTTDPQTQDSQDDPQPIICCFWNDKAPASVQVAKPSENEVTRQVATDINVQSESIESTAAKNQTEAVTQVVEATTDNLNNDRVVDVDPNELATVNSDPPAEQQNLGNAGSAGPVNDTQKPDQVVAANQNSEAENILDGESEIQSVQVEDGSQIDSDSESQLQEKIDRWAEERRQNHGQSEKTVQPENVKGNTPKPEAQTTDAAEATTAEPELVAEEATAQSDADDQPDQQDTPEGESAFGRSRRSKKEGSRVFRPDNSQPGEQPQVNTDKKPNLVNQSKLDSLRQSLSSDPVANQDVGSGEASNASKGNPSNAVATGLVASPQGTLKDAQTKFTVNANAPIEGAPTSATANSAVKSETPLPNNQTQSTKTTAKSTLQRLPPQTINRITSALKEAPNGDSSLRLRLNPVELGSVEIEIAFRNGVMSAKLKAEKGQTQQMLQEGLDSLKTRLSEHGISIESLEVELGSDSSSSNTGGQTRQEFASGQNRQSSGFFEQQQQRRSETENRTKPTDEPSNTEVDSVGQWAVNVVA